MNPDTLSSKHFSIHEVTAGRIALASSEAHCLWGYVSLPDVYETFCVSSNRTKRNHIRANGLTQKRSYIQPPILLLIICFNIFHQSACFFRQIQITDKVVKISFFNKWGWDEDQLAPNDMIWYDMVWYDTIWYDMIYLLTAIGLSPGGSTHLHTNNT